MSCESRTIPEHDGAGDSCQGVGFRGATGGTLRHIRRVIAKKNVVEYEERRLTEKEVQAMAEHARRFLKWANKMLPDK